MMQGTICLQCGDKGFWNAFVYCVKCVKLAVHRYCLDVIPETFDEFVYWVCDDCELEAQRKFTPVNNRDAGPTPTRDHMVAEEESVNLLSDINEEEENDLSAVRKEEHDHKHEPAKSNNALEEKRGNDINEEEENGLSAVREEEHDHKDEPAKSNKDLEEKRGNDINEEEENGLSALREEEHDHKDEPAKSNNALEEKKGNDKVRRQKRRLRKEASESTIKSTRRSRRKIKFTKENNKSIPAKKASSHKKEKNKERIKAFVGSEKDKKTLGNNASSCKKEKNERAKANGNKGPEQGERNHVFVRSSREKKRKRDSKWPSKKEEDEKGSTEKIVKKRRISSGKSKTKKPKATIPSEKIHDKEKQETCSEKPLVANIQLPKDGERGNFTNGDKNNLCESSPKDSYILSAEPVAMPIWRGSFDIRNEKRVMLSGVLGHVSILACQKVYDEALQFEAVLHLELLPKSDVWPKSFVTSEPSGDNIALYFFPSKKSEQDFDRLVDEMMRKELALKACVQNAELLIFNSSELPLLYWKFQGKYYLWGVFRQKQSTVSNFHPCREELNGKNPIKGTDKIVGSTKGPNALSPCSPLSNSASNCSHT
ncbi:RING/FYVE/PHD zinc finger superfamily protein [Striga hermonthica]|uniref:RING/FYVE/PHD zinc finger superfamily protein n=1 Tax=Striga hermonthica TaxID=68872 RepID=A0A9N7RI46_STRHE|nr:RING/FYVE/PHD zinc finger superfamily protein [Striga hermonthica]